MKYVILVGDGMPDTPLKELGGKTPLEVADTPNMDIVASFGTCGMANFVPANLPPGSDVANLSIFGYDPKKYYTGRGPFEAASMGVELEEGDVAFRCNLVNIADGIMDDYSAGHISSAEAKKIIAELNASLADENVRFYPGISYRHLCVIKNGPRLVKCTPPHDITGKDSSSHMPKGNGASLVKEIMAKALPVLSRSAVNKKRIASGNKPASSIWLWGQGIKPSMPTYAEKFGISGSVITAVDLIKGIGVYAGLDVINVPGATGYLDTNYKGKAEYALRSLKVKDFVLVHVESPDETGHNGDVKGKIKAIEDFDRLVVGTILEGLKKFKDYRVLVTADHPTPLAIKTHSRGSVPFAMFGSGTEKGPIKRFSEKDIARSPIVIDRGCELASKLFKKGL